MTNSLCGIQYAVVSRSNKQHLRTKHFKTKILTSTTFSALGNRDGSNTAFNEFILFS